VDFSTDIIPRPDRDRQTRLITEDFNNLCFLQDNSRVKTEKSYEFLRDNLEKALRFPDQAKYQYIPYDNEGEFHKYVV